jgi:pimeloyl-ACP methyl ester carboxylesterase
MKVATSAYPASNRSPVMESRTAVLDGIAMRWEEQGDGLPLVLIHGIPTSPALWHDVIPRIVGARCLAWEMVGYGGSIAEGHDRDISVGRQADYLVRWLRHLGIERAVLAGHDLGGGVAQVAATRHRELCAGLFLTNSIGYDSWPIPSVAAMQKLHPIVSRLPDAVFSRVFRLFLQRGHERPEQARRAYRAHWGHYESAGAARAFVRQIRALDSSDTRQLASRLKKLRIPARIAWGTADRFQKVRYGERFARDLKAPLRRLEGARHFTPEDRPADVAEELNSLLVEARAAA